MERISETALDAVLREVAATPKPGLVDRADSGAHDDMDFCTFQRSAAAIAPFLSGFAALGHATRELPQAQALAALKKLGLKAEQAMFEATGGVNTHKGMIYSLGLCCAASGRIMEDMPLTARNICAAAARLAAGEARPAHPQALGGRRLTNGERMRRRYGAAGARGEAQSGFATVRTVSYPVFSELLARGVSVNDALAQTLLHLIPHTRDTNILARCGMRELEHSRLCAIRALELGGVLTAEGLAFVEEMNRDFSARRISPGGCADLLAVTYYLHQINTAIDDARCYEITTAYN